MKTLLLLNLIIFCSILNAQTIWLGTTNSDWETASNWMSNSVPNLNDSVVIPVVTNSPVLSVDRSVGDITILPGATLNLGSKKLTVYEDLCNNGNITTSGSTVIFSGLATQNIYGSHTFKNIEINNPNGVNIQSGSTSITGYLNLISGTFETNDSLVLISDSLGTASIMEIPIGADISGDVEIQRYVNSTAPNWRFLSLPIEGASFNDWNDDLITTGIIGSDYPNWPSAANPWSSINRYNESDTGHQDLGFFAPTSMSDTINDAEGFWVWSGDTITGDQPFLINTRGAILKNDVNMPVKYTNSGNLNSDGWNMLGNPYPSTIDWDDSDWIKTNVDNAIYIYDPENLQYASYVSGVPNNGGTQYISSSQGFWVKASGSNPVLTAKEGVKSTVDTTFFKQSSQPFSISVQIGQYKDQVSFNFNSNASLDYDSQYDAYKIYSSSNSVPSICAISDDNHELSINSFSGTESVTIPIKITAFSSGTANITFSNVVGLSGFNCIYLEDKLTGLFIDIHSSASYSFFLSSTTDTSRFLLHMSTVISFFNSVDTVFYSNNQAEYSPSNNSIGTDYLWDFGDNNISLLTSPVHNYSYRGSYTVTLTASNSKGCTNVMSKEIHVISNIITSLDEFAQKEFKIYPNPVRIGEVVNLEMEGSGDYYLEIFDIMGKRVFEKLITTEVSSISIDNKFNSGIYYLNLQNENNKQVQSFKLTLTN